MKIRLYLLLLFIFPFQWITGQLHYNVDKTIFSSNDYDEFSPVYFRDRIVYCSNFTDELFFTYQTKDKKGLFNIFSISVNDTLWNKKPVIFSRNVETPFNDGPASFSADGNVMVYSRNVDAEAKRRNFTNKNNTLGLFFAEFKNGEWTNITGFKYNSITYSISTPFLSPDGRYLYFSSDMAGGFGAMDIYRSELVEQNWSEPENLGAVINTKGNEAYPFIAQNGDLFFASDGHGGLGKKDIFQAKPDEDGWMIPHHLEAPINSEYDDFGLITDSDFSSGYFSSNRENTDDIFKFSTILPQLFDCDTLKKNNYCYEFWDEKFPGLDTLPVIYEWEFSDGVKIRGLKVEHCFPGAGSYWAKLKIIDSSTDETFLTQTSMEFELTDFEQPFISSRDASLINKEMEFSGLASNLPGFNIETYIWDFGDGSFTTGSQVNHIFNKAGIYEVKLGVSGYYEGNKQKETKCVIKPIAIVMDNQALALHMAGIESIPIVDEPGDIRNDTSKISQELSRVTVKTYILAELPAEIVAKINSELSGLADASIEFKRSEVSGDDIKMLDRVVKILEDNPDIIMEIAAHTDNIESFENSIIISQKRVEAIVDYLVSKGIEKQRLVGKGYGESNPISSNSTEEGRMKNYRVEFIILNDKQ